MPQSTCEEPEPPRPCSWSSPFTSLGLQDTVGKQSLGLEDFPEVWVPLRAGAVKEGGRAAGREVKKSPEKGYMPLGSWSTTLK